MIRETVIFGLVGGLLIGCAMKLALLEQRAGGALRARAARQQVARVLIPAQRGEILDTRSRSLAACVRRPSVFVDPSRTEDPREFAQLIAPAFGLNAADLEQAIVERREREFHWIKRRISDGELAAFEAVRDEYDLTSCGIQYEQVRTYPFGAIAPQVLGFVNAEMDGIIGVEHEFNRELKGTSGERRATVDVKRRRVRSLDDEYLPPRDGLNVVLTLDAHLQQRAEYHLRRAVEQYDAKWGAALLMDPRTGELLAMATWPGFDLFQPVPPGTREEDVAEALEPTRNRAISDSYEPGSIFKPFIASLAVDAGVVSLDDGLAINGPTHQFGRRTIHDTSVHSHLAVWEVISKSSNIGMGMIGDKCGNARLHEFVRRFGFGEPTGITLPGEHGGLLRDLDGWSGFSTQSIPIGQEVAATPVQLLSAFASFANGGILMRPRIVRGIVDATGVVVRDESMPVPVRRVLSASVAERFREKALVECVRSGTGKNAAIADYQVFGKTGTAQVAFRDQRGLIPDQYVGSFMGGAPSDDPRVVALVTIYRPARGRQYYGGTVAAPTAGAILADALAYMRVPPEAGMEPTRARPPLAGRAGR